MERLSAIIAYRTAESLVGTISDGLAGVDWSALLSMLSATIKRTSQHKSAPDSSTQDLAAD
eukprot:15452539-Alexandrium_andersonii.AAC.1